MSGKPLLPIASSHHSSLHVAHYFRYYVGACPKVAVADVELAKEIMVKEFECFRDRGLLVSWGCWGSIYYIMHITKCVYFNTGSS